MKNSGNYPAWMDAWPLALLGIAAAIASLFFDSTGLRYERAAILDGEWWRLASGQVVHLGVSHLLLNLAGLAMIAWVFGPGLRAAQWLWLLAGSWAGIAAGFLLLEPQLTWYVGLSGLLHGLLIGAAVLDRGLERWARVLLVAGLLAKLAWEQWAGALPFTADVAGGPVVVDAHLYGGLGGLIASGVRWLRLRRAAPV